MKPTMSLRRLRPLVPLARRAGELLWLLGAGLLTAVGLAGTAGLMGWSATWWLFVGSTTFAGMVAFTWQLAEGQSFAPVLWVGLVAGTGMVIVVGLVDLLGAPALAIVALLAVLHPRVGPAALRLARHGNSKEPERRTPGPRPAGRTDRLPPPVRPPVAGDVHFVVPDEVTVDDLCQAWCSSYVALQRAQTLRARLSAVQMRALYLDDLERRLGDDFARWLTSVPRAAQDPRSFLQARELAPESARDSSPGGSAGIDTLGGGPEPGRPAA
jgi:hypothetical protein